MQKCKVVSLNLAHPVDDKVICYFVRAVSRGYRSTIWIDSPINI